MKLRPCLFIFLFSLFTICFPQTVIEPQGNIHLALKRREFETNFQKTVPDLKQLTCMVDNPDKIKKKTNKRVTELCFFRNLFYNVEVSIGLNSKEKFELALDLMSPYTWVKSDNCENCYTNKKSERICSNDCTMLDFSQTHQCIKKKKCLKTNESATLDYVNHNFTGEFVYERLKIESIDDEIPLVNVKRFKILDVEVINNSPNYFSDGALGLAFEEEASSNNSESSEENAGIMTAIINAAPTIEDRIFSIYIRENNTDDDTYIPTIIFGDVNPEYQDNDSDVIDYIQINSNSRFDWDLPISSLKLKSSDKIKEISFDKSCAILTLDTTFIALPTREMKELLDYLNSIDLNCKTDKEKFDSLVCSNVVKSKLLAFQMNFVFVGDDNKPHTIKIDPLSLVKDCSGTLEGDKSVSCYFLLHTADSKTTILGEAFMKNYYTIFNMETQKVGFVEGAMEADEPIIHIVKRETRKFSRFLKYFFILLGIVVAILCPFYVYQLCKIYRRRKSMKYDEGNSMQIEKIGIGEETAYDFQQEMKEKLEERRKAEEVKKASEV